MGEKDRKRDDALGFFSRGRGGMQSSRSSPLLSCTFSFPAGEGGMKKKESGAGLLLRTRFPAPSPAPYGF